MGIFRLVFASGSFYDHDILLSYPRLGWNIHDSELLQGMGSRPQHLLYRNTPSILRINERTVPLHTANRREGWGVVLNEAMNSGCAVVASHIVGAVPYLINDGDNGLVFKDGDVDDLYKKIKSLLDDPEKTKHICKNAYKTVTEMWNCDNTANRFVSLAKEMLSGNMSPELFESGPCSKAEIIEDNWYENDRKE